MFVLPTGKNKLNPHSRNIDLSDVTSPHDTTLLPQSILETTEEYIKEAPCMVFMPSCQYTVYMCQMTILPLHYKACNYKIFMNNIIPRLLPHSLQHILMTQKHTMKQIIPDFANLWYLARLYRMLMQCVSQLRTSPPEVLVAW